jgi:transcriptional regulator of acetoin/glycerol metabolism
VNVTLTATQERRADDDSPPVGPFLSQVFHVERPTSSSRRLDLAALSRVEIGRGARDDVRPLGGGVVRVDIADAGVSTLHARLLRGEGGWRLGDAGSKNGSYVDGEAAHDAPLADGATIEIGGAFFVFRGPRRLPPLVAGESAAWGMLSGLTPPLHTHNPDLAQTFTVLARLASSSLPVLLSGESGTGKELVARAIHGLSGRGGRFVAVNCGAIPQNLVESELFGVRRGAFSGADEDRAGFVRAADGGTLFLDEIAELGGGAQAALLRVLQEHEVVPLGQTRALPVDIRLVAATHADLAARVERGLFRADLYARVAGFLARLPPLRARREDLGLVLARLARAGELEDGFTLTRSAARLLLARPFALNVRELAHALGTALLVAPKKRIDARHLELAPQSPAVPLSSTDTTSPDGATARPAPAAPDEDARKDRLVALLGKHHGNLSAVARELATSRTQVQRLMDRFGLRREQF